MQHKLYFVYLRMRSSTAFSRPSYSPLLIILLAACLSCGGGRSTDRQRGGEKRSAPARQVGAIHTDLPDLQASGEMIVATLSGPDTYFDYHGQPAGLQYTLAANFAAQQGLRLRVETAADTASVLAMLVAGEADIVLLQLPGTMLREKQLVSAGASDSSKHTSWALRTDQPALREALNNWFSPSLFQKAQKQEETTIARARQVRRHVHAPYISREKGILSTYDALFRQAAATTGWDWRLIAAQCYQESGFDPNAISYAGARGLMQVMPNTAEGLGHAAARLFEPEENLRCAARYLRHLQALFSDVPDATERTKLVLAAYNGGPGHVRDAMSLARKHGANPERWDDVAIYIRRLSDPHFYRDPVVRHGYMIGQETANYVPAILARYQAYGGTSLGGVSHLPIGTAAPASPPVRQAPPRHNRFSRPVDIKTPEELSAGK